MIRYLMIPWNLILLYYHYLTFQLLIIIYIEFIASVRIVPKLKLFV